MIDIHTHILPELDDGSRNVEESIKMLCMLSEQGVDTVVATPHFYIDMKGVEDFAQRRQAAVEKLMQAIPENMKRPQIAIGAEVQFYSNLYNLENIDEFCISGTNFILVEMPFTPWTDMVYESLSRIYTTRGIVPIIAHFERYPEFSKMWDAASKLKKANAVIQINGGFVEDNSERRKILKMCKKGNVGFWGSDAHNTTSRPPNLGKAFSVLENKLKPFELEVFEYWEEKLKKNLVTF